MSKAVDRMRSRSSSYKDGILAFDELSGDDAKKDDSKKSDGGGDSGGGYMNMIGPMISEIFQTGAAVASDQQKKSDASKKSAADQAKLQNTDLYAAQVTAQQMHKAANDTAMKAQVARARANATRSPVDLAAADRAEKLAAMSKIDAQSADSKVAQLQGGGGGSSSSPGGSGDAPGDSNVHGGHGKSASFPTWGKIALGVGGAAVVGGVGYLVLKKK